MSLIIAHRYKTAVETLQPAALPEEELPCVTVQLPIYNEKYVVRRLLQAVSQFDYPTSRLDIQVLDDSTDETAALAADAVAEMQAQGFDIVHLQRSKREGYKAGALQSGLAQAKGEFVAILDADFLPHPDFLRKLLIYFQFPTVGVVQSRWSHLNPHQSLLTRVQAMLLDLHFALEQSGRMRQGVFLTFNGTAGIWRKRTILQAGGWHTDTLSEDLDLSIRAQLLGWRILYQEFYSTPAELPPTWAAWRGQQERWAQGGAAVAAKLLPKVWRSSLPFRSKCWVTQQLTAAWVYVFSFAALLLGLIGTLPAGGGRLPSFIGFALPTVVVCASLISIGYVQAVVLPTVEQARVRPLRLLFSFAAMLLVGIGTLWGNAAAAWRGIRGKQASFVRTPKSGTFQANMLQQLTYFQLSLARSQWQEGLLCLLFIAGANYAFGQGNLQGAAYQLLPALGFGAMLFVGWRERSRLAGPSAKRKGL